jgi:hypothetical protein
MVAYACNPRICEAEIGGSRGQPELHRESLSHKTKTSQLQLFTSEIQATSGVEIRRIGVQSQLSKKSETSSHLNKQAGCDGL